ncbi:hypothetical protein [Thermogymnomonas acidicola]|uniref:alpha-amylase family glycosyl hydrolase n=1 Tax=Thermogymnomonas acidicola TaxID=399579 RepID=UPI0013968714|nr:alpha-amylase family glycosyl hydrolase [Thermogymnomonas acidicola]
MPLCTVPEITSTYRLQLSGSFRFGDALKALDYIKGLGISHLYLSPITEARKGSSHFYDVVDYSKVSEQLGGERDLISLSRACQSGGMGIIIDFVPNHMAYSRRTCSSGTSWSTASPPGTQHTLTSGTVARRTGRSPFRSSLNPTMPAWKRAH